MDNKTVVLNFKCPKCGCPARAEIKKQMYKFLIYVCPECDSNVVYYGNKVDILSDELVESMTKKKKLQFLGPPMFPKKPKVKPERADYREITDDILLDLKILLNTETDFNTFLSKL